MASAAHTTGGGAWSRPRSRPPSSGGWVGWCQWEMLPYIDGILRINIKLTNMYIYIYIYINITYTIYVQMVI